MISWLTHVAAWMGVLLLTIASWTPAPLMVRTGLNGQLEHFAAYMLTGLALMGAYRSPLILALSLICYGAVLEVGQLFVHGRHAAVLDWVASATGALWALVLFVAFAKMMRQRAPSRN
jgi:VanZ family protein